MRKRIIAILSAAVFTAAFAACGSQQPAASSSESAAASESKAASETASASEAQASSEETSEQSSTKVVGGWTMPESMSGAMSNEAAAAFEKAKESYDDPGLAAISQLGSQVVAGENYMLLCRDMTTDSWKVAIVYEDPSEKCEITSVTDFDLGKYAQDDSGKAGEQGLAGGWTVYKDPSGQPVELPEEVDAAFNKAMEGLTGADYMPVLYMGSQVVNGANYAVLCEQTLVTADPVTNLAIVYIYAPATGDPQIMNIYPLDLAELNS